MKPAAEKAGHAATVLTMDVLQMSRTKWDSLMVTNRKQMTVNGNQKCSDFGNSECSIFGIKTTVLLASAVQ